MILQSELSTCDGAESTGWGTHMLAGALAGISEHTVIYPVDAIKVRFERDLGDRANSPVAHC